MYDCNGTIAQKFRLSGTKEVIFRSDLNGDNKCIDISGWAPANNGDNDDNNDNNDNVEKTDDSTRAYR